MPRLLSDISLVCRIIWFLQQSDPISVFSLVLMCSHCICAALQVQPLRLSGTVACPLCQTQHGLPTILKCCSPCNCCLPPYPPPRCYLSEFFTTSVLQLNRCYSAPSCGMVFAVLILFLSGLHEIERSRSPVTSVFFTLSRKLARVGGGLALGCSSGQQSLRCTSAHLLELLPGASESVRLAVQLYVCLGNTLSPESAGVETLDWCGAKGVCVLKCPLHTNRFVCILKTKQGPLPL